MTQYRDLIFNEFPFNSFAYGLYTCVVCLDSYKSLKTKKFNHAVVDGTLILIPAGKQKVCDKCISDFPWSEK